MAQSTAHRRLLQEYRALTNNPPDGITAGPVSEDDLLHWEALIQGPEGTPFEGGIFPAELRFPKDYPLAPPKMTFLGEIFHPNVYPSGLVCISILHPPGDDPNHYEHASERWSPIQSVEKILISVMSMLAEPNDESPANVEAAKMWRDRRPEYEARVRESVRRMLGLGPDKTVANSVLWPEFCKFDLEEAIGSYLDHRRGQPSPKQFAIRFRERKSVYSLKKSDGFWENA
ncbi:hypothetical protein DL768_010024 [Monosporascus sp. mg162]|nr:hypothetical protein DL768_010024 [Monosporascus sp. mg162]